MPRCSGVSRIDKLEIYDFQEFSRLHKASEVKTKRKQKQFQTTNKNGINFKKQFIEFSTIRYIERGSYFSSGRKSSLLLVIIVWFLYI